MLYSAEKLSQLPTHKLLPKATKQNQIKSCDEHEHSPPLIMEGQVTFPLSIPHTPDYVTFSLLPSCYNTPLIIEGQVTFLLIQPP